MAVISSIILAISGAAREACEGLSPFIYILVILGILCLVFTLVARSRPSLRTGFLASRTGLYSSGMNRIGDLFLYEGSRGSLQFLLGIRPVLGATTVTRRS